MAADWKREPISREPSPEERALKADEEPSSDSDLSPAEAEIIKKIWRRMKLFRPHLYKVFKPWIDSLQLRDERSGYSHGVYRRWYAEQARRLRLTENAVKARLKTAQRWFADRIRRELHRK